MNSIDADYDDLTAIDSIGDTRQQWLRELLGVRSFQDLADLTVAQIESQLQKAGHRAPLSDIEKWITGAKELVLANATTLEQEEPVTEEDIPTQRRGKWRRLASFAVAFEERETESQSIVYRTTVEHSEVEDSGGTESWPRIEGKQLCQWMLKKIKNKQEPPHVTSIDEDETTMLTSLSLSPVISQIQFYSPPNATLPTYSVGPNQPISLSVDSVKNCAIEAIFQLAVQTNADKVQVDSQADFVVINRGTGAIRRFTTTVPITFADQ